MLSKLYKQLPAVRAEYSVTSPEIREFIAKLKKDLKGRGVTKRPWKLARKVSIFVVVKVFLLFCPWLLFEEGNVCILKFPDMF